MYILFFKKFEYFSFMYIVMRMVQLNSGMWLGSPSVSSTPLTHPNSFKATWTIMAHRLTKKMAKMEIGLLLRRWEILTHLQTTHGLWYRSCCCVLLPGCCWWVVVADKSWSITWKPTQGTPLKYVFTFLYFSFITYVRISLNLEKLVCREPKTCT